MRAVAPRWWLGQEGRLVAQAWLGSRLIIFLAALVLAIQQQQAPGRVMNNWDADLYGIVAREGYLAHPDLMAFFPGLPLLLRAGLVIGIPAVATGVVLSAIGSAFAAAALHRLANPWVAIAWLFAPTAVFTAVPYTEALFCAAAFWAWERARAWDWRAAGILAGVAASFRVSGVFLIAALAVLAITTVSRPWSARLRAGLWLLVPVAVIGAYFGYLYAITGNPIAWYDAQRSGWVREFTWPWEAALNTWPVIKPGGYPDNPWWAEVFRFEVASMVLGLLTTGWCLGRRRWAEAVWVGSQVLAFSTSYWFYSVNRATLLWFPLWIMLVELARLRPSRPGWAVVHKLTVSAAATGMVCTMVWWCWLFFTGHWAS
ncbi:hypothetical protein [Microlunatus sp. Y2014]|uniref:hypothetical protein n=1 Tax=Microlunatus sp. Y2014 TaxID=3418488 RepID=UPI003DA712C5